MTTYLEEKLLRDVKAKDTEITSLREQLAELHTLRPASEWHEDFGPVLWWQVPIQEPPYVGCGTGMGEKQRDGTPTPCRTQIESGWLTHWSPIPRNPEMKAKG